MALTCSLLEGGIKIVIICSTTIGSRTTIRGRGYGITDLTGGTWYCAGLLLVNKKVGIVYLVYRENVLSKVEFNHHLGGRTPDAY